MGMTSMASVAKFYLLWGGGRSARAGAWWFSLGRGEGGPAVGGVGSCSSRDDRMFSEG